MIDDGSEAAASGAQGQWIEWSSWGGNLVFGLTAIPAALGMGSIEDPAIVVCLALFFASLVIWTWALFAAFVRSAGGDDVAVTTLFLLEGRVPKRARWSLYGAFAVCLAIAAATAAFNPFGVLVPMYSLGLVGLWGARHGTFPPRRDVPSR